MKNTVTAKQSAHRRPKRHGNLKKRGNYWWARWTYHGTTFERSTNIRVDMVDEKGNPCGRKIAEKILDSYVQPFQLKDTADTIAVLLNRLKDANKAAEDPVTPRLKDLGETFKSSSRRNDITEQHLKSW